MSDLDGFWKPLAVIILIGEQAQLSSLDCTALPESDHRLADFLVPAMARIFTSWRMGKNEIIGRGWKKLEDCVLYLLLREGKLLQAIIQVGDRTEAP